MGIHDEFHDVVVFVCNLLLLDILGGVYVLNGDVIDLDYLTHHYVCPLWRKARWNSAILSVLLYVLCGHL